DQIAGFIDARKGAVARLPACGCLFLAVAAPALGRLAVEQQPPAVSPLLLGQRVWRRRLHGMPNLRREFLDRPQAEVAEIDFGAFRLELDAAAREWFLAAVDPATGVGQHQVDRAIDDMDGSLPEAIQLQLIPRPARLLIVVGVKDAGRRADESLA